MAIDLDKLDTTPIDELPAPKPASPYLKEALDRLRNQTPAYTQKARQATPGQIRYVAVLLKNAGKVNPDAAKLAKEWWLSKAIEPEGDWVHATTLNFDQVSATINRLKSIVEGPTIAARVVTPRPDMSAFQELLAALWTEEVKPHPSHGVTLCRYALRWDDAAEGTNTVRFYKLKESKAGKRYLVQQVSGDEIFLKFENGAMEVARRIAEDVLAAVQLYGTELEHCGDCGRELTNDESRRVGIGPYCRGRWGM